MRLAFREKVEILFFRNKKTGTLEFIRNNYLK